MRDLLQTAHQVQDFLDRQGWCSCIIGGLAVLRAELQPLCALKGAPEILQRLEKLRRTLETP